MVGDLNYRNIASPEEVLSRVVESSRSCPRFKPTTSTWLMDGNQYYEKVLNGGSSLLTPVLEESSGEKD